LSKTPPRIDRSRVRTVPARRRSSKVQLRSEARPHQPGASLAAFLDGLPGLLGARDLRDAIAAAARARTRGRTILWGFGAHVIKVGLAPIVVDLLERGFESLVAHECLGNMLAQMYRKRYLRRATPATHSRAKMQMREEITADNVLLTVGGPS
jgi:hypothetical protein